jgi:hypothetical protein
MIMNVTEYADQARARLWNLMLGGGEAYENERWLLAYLQAVVPNFETLARQENGFVDRFWRLATGGLGIAQVLYIGAPLPVGLPPHKRLPAPGRVVYVERDELLCRKGEAWMAEQGAVDVLHVDPFDVTAMITQVDAFDWFEPVAVIAPGVLSWVDEGTARTWVKQVVEELAPGSYVATTHLLDPEVPSAVSPLHHKLDAAGVGVSFFRRRSTIERLFPGLALERPGVVLAADWWPNGPRLRQLELVDQLLAAAVVSVPRSP